MIVDKKMYKKASLKDIRLIKHAAMITVPRQKIKEILRANSPKLIPNFQLHTPNQSSTIQNKIKFPRTPNSIAVKNISFPHL